MTDRENTLRAANFEQPEHIPVGFNISGACWDFYSPNALHDLMESHPLLFPGFTRPAEAGPPAFAPWQRAGQPYTDSWGCVWRTAENGLTGAVVKHALADWSALDTFQPPDPDRENGWGPIDWRRTRRQLRTARRNGRLRSGNLRHGHTFLTLSYLRGYENLIVDMADADPRLLCLIQAVEDFNLGLVRRFVDCGVEWMGYPEDLGMQSGPMLSPDHFRRYIKPVYRRLIAPAREAGCVIHMHSDGDVRALAGDLLECGVQVLNLQDLVNGVDWIREKLKGRVCVDLDIDRQRITRYGTPAEIDRHVRDIVRVLGDARGGLMLKHGLYPGIPLPNVQALMDAMEKYALHFA